MDKKDINFNVMSTENRNLNTMNLDIMTSFEIVKAMNEEDKKVPLAVEKELFNISGSVK